MAQDRKEYKKDWYQTHKEEVKARSKTYFKTNKGKRKVWIEENREHINAYRRTYRKTDRNSLGQSKDTVRSKSNYYLNKYGTKITGYEIHHCCTYNEPYKFIYCSKETHQLIHSYLREHNIDADSEHYEQIKHLLDDTVVLYGIN